MRNATSAQPEIAGTDQLLSLALRVAAAEALWQPLVRHDPALRWHTRLARTPEHEVWLIGWTPEQGVELHDHGTSAGVFVVTEGELVEQRFDVCERRLYRTRCPAGVARTIEPGSVHRVWNAGRGLATSIHVYSPPLASMTYYVRGPSGVLRPTRTEGIRVAARATNLPWQLAAPLAHRRR